jgi:hypothetical protein
MTYRGGVHESQTETDVKRCWERFPLRMVPALRRAPRWLHKFLDKYLGTMVYVTLRRSSSSMSS